MHAARPRLIPALLTAAILTATGGAALADLIQLKDGRSISGTLTRETVDGKPALLIKPDPLPDGTALDTIITTPDQLQRVTLTGAITPAQAADAEWTRIAYLIQKASDLATIIDLHQKFLDKFPDQPLTPGVRTSMEQYERLDREKAVKFRGRWMPAVQVNVLLRTWDDEARPAVDLYRAGKIREASEAAAQLVAANDQNPVALTIAGLAAYRLNNLNTAREFFKRLGAADPSTPLPENNLAIIAIQQNNPVESLLHYTKALQTDPNNRLLLDNIEEAFANYPADRTSTIYTDLLRQFTIAEARMEADYAKKSGGGLYRWGSTWVSRDQFTRLTTYRRSVQQAMANLDKQYQDVRTALAAITDQINQAAADYNNTLNAVNSLNNLIAQYTYTADTYTEISRRDALMLDLATFRAKKSALEAQRDQLIFATTDFFNQAEKLKAALALSDATLYPGIQRIMQLNEDKSPPPPLPIAVAQIPGGAPAPAPAAPAPQPTTDQRAQQKIAETYRHLSTPIGLPMPLPHPR